jgi:hypothetical protein
MDAASPARRSALAGRSYSGAVSAAWLSAAWLLAIVHLAAIAFLVVGGVLALHRPILVWAHVVVVAAVATIFLTGRDCPLTVMQKACLRRSGRIPYAAGFVEHYLVRPIAGHAGGGAGTAVIIACWVVPTVTSYSVLARRWWRRAGPTSALTRRGKPTAQYVPLLRHPGVRWARHRPAA